MVAVVVSPVVVPPLEPTPEPPLPPKHSIMAKLRALLAWLKSELAADIAAFKRFLSDDE